MITRPVVFSIIEWIASPQHLSLLRASTRNSLSTLEGLALHQPRCKSHKGHLQASLSVGLVHVVSSAGSSLLCPRACAYHHRSSIWLPPRRRPSCMYCVSDLQLKQLCCPRAIASLHVSPPSEQVASAYCLHHVLMFFLAYFEYRYHACTSNLHGYFRSLQLSMTRSSSMCTKSFVANIIAYSSTTPSHVLNYRVLH